MNQSWKVTIIWMISTFFNDSNPLFARWTGSGFEPSITLAEDSLITGCYKQRVTEWSFSINTSHESNLTLKYWQPFPSIRPTVCTITTKICVLLTLDMSDQDTIKLQWFIGGLRLGLSGFTDLNILRVSGRHESSDDCYVTRASLY